MKQYLFYLLKRLLQRLDIIRTERHPFGRSSVWAFQQQRKAAEKIYGVVKHGK